ncbi:dephospho-CoA kinase [Shewanella cyperi]|uniref:dephospho-CoA kinase n=1 Tax=Shewanella cyperi TaxID=2814292 RepID=UPI001A94169E|nr:dephospho-CoA kinase [Shewanella cyperi]QSX40533.1 dephospho-CoA kinase [Shewanella cyperi]
MKKYLVGLTGGIGSGKTTVANGFLTHGIKLVDADIVAREVVEPGSPGLEQIRAHFGNSVINGDGTLNRGHLREIVFANPQHREWLNNLLHPMIRTRMLELVEKANSPYVILIAPLLFENGLDRLVNRTLVVDISPEKQIARTMARDKVSETQVNNIIASQMSREDRLAKADDIIDNNGDVAGIEDKVAELHSLYMTLSQSQ